jgi:hypothetical protein
METATLIHWPFRSRLQRKNRYRHNTASKRTTRKDIFFLQPIEGSLEVFAGFVNSRPAESPFPAGRYSAA